MKTTTSYIKIFCVALLLCGLTILSSCQKNQDVTTPSFNVTVDSTNYKAGTPVVFKITGDADVISFYSGVSGSQYVNKGRNVVQGTPQMQFASYQQPAAAQNTSLHLLISKDFSNTYAIPDVQAATWTDITSRATFSTGTDNTASGVIDLSDFATDANPVFIAFKYTASAKAAQPNWIVKNLAITNKLDNGTLASVATSANIGWGTVNVMGSQIWAFNTTQIQMVGSVIGTPDNEDWCISQRLFLNRVTPDLGVNVKASPTSIPLPTYSFTYTTAGTYTATFVAQNNSAWNSKTTVKEFTITVK